ncbi:MAG: alanine racemase [Naasia sp.]
MSGGSREAVIDSAAISRNVEALARAVSAPAVMAVVKADGYGHGALTAARAALDGGADWLGVADLDEAMQLRSAGVAAPLLAWLHDPFADFAPAVDAGVDIGVSTAAQLEALAEIGGRGARPTVQFKVETGLNRNGLAPEDWEKVAARAVELERLGRLRVRGIFSHLANTDADSDAAAVVAFDRAVAIFEAAGASFELRHLASTAGALSRPDARFDLVRLGIGIYGLSPFGDSTAPDGAAPVELTPAMTLRSRIAAVRDAEAGDGVSYDHTWRSEEATRLALVPIGYADGVPRAASGRAEVSVGGRRVPVRGRIAMDQFVVEIGGADIAVGDEVVLFGDPQGGVPSADDWARWSGTINYEVVTRIGPRVRRVS